MSTQLRLVEPPGDGARSRPARRKRRARTVPAPRARQVHWAGDWRLDASARRIGREGVAAARAVLDRARRPDTGLPRAS
jgi:hypothetical protein